jgi:hypothetical protein
LIVQKITTTKPLTMKAKIKIEAEIEFDEDCYIYKIMNGFVITHSVIHLRLLYE